MNTQYEYDKANFDVSSMSEDEIKRRLKAMGFPVGSWSASENEGETIIKTLPTFQKQALLLQQLSELLGSQIGEDQKTINSLAEKRQRLLHGGGQ